MVRQIGPCTAGWAAPNRRRGLNACDRHTPLRMVAHLLPDCLSHSTPPVPPKDNTKTSSASRSVGYGQILFNHHRFDTTPRFFNSSNLKYYRWQTDQTIDLSSSLARPAIFLSIDQFATAGSRGQEDDVHASRDEMAAGKP